MLSSYGYSMAPTEQVQWGLGSYLESLWRALALGVPMLSAAWVIAALLAVTGCIVALRSRRDRASAAVVTYVAVAVPIALLAYVGSGWRVSKLPTQAWHYLPLVALIGLGLDVGVYALARQVAGGRTVRAAAAGVVALLVARDVMAAVSVRMTNIDLSARMIGETARPQDIVVVYPWFCGETFQRYYRGAAPWITIPDVPDHLYHPLALVAEKIKLGDAGFAPELARVEHVLRDGGRVWVVGGLLAPPLGEPAPHLPPAPDGPWGWQSAPYLTGWLTQLGALLQTHARTIRKIDLPPTGPVNEFEDAPLLVAEGWY